MQWTPISPTPTPARAPSPLNDGRKESDTCANDQSSVCSAQIRLTLRPSPLAFEPILVTKRSSSFEESLPRSDSWHRSSLSSSPASSGTFRTTFPSSPSSDSPRLSSDFGSCGYWPTSSPGLDKSRNKVHSVRNHPLRRQVSAEVRQCGTESLPRSWSIGSPG